MNYVIEFRSGSYFVSDDAERGGTLARLEAHRLREGAEAYANKREWIWFNGGMVVDARTVRS